MQTIIDKKTKDKRTVMYSVERIEKKDGHGKGIGEYEGRVVEHHLPWNPDDKWGMQKLIQMEKRGFTFERPTETSQIAQNVLPSPAEEPAPLYVSEKPKKPKMKRKVKK